MKTEGRLSVAGADLYYDVEGDGPAVVLVHGFSLDGRMWDEQVTALRDIATVVRCDLRGFGRSSNPKDGVPYTHSADVLTLLDHLGIDDALLVGLSMGGLVALESALAAPKRVRELVLLDSLLDGVHWDRESAEAMRAAETAAVTQGVAAAKRVWFDHPFFTPARRDPAVADRLKALVAPYSGFHWTHRDPQTAVTPTPFAVLERVRVQATVVVGALDVPCFRVMSDVLASRIPGARRVDIPDCGHMSNLEAPDVVNAVLREAV